MQRFRPVQVLIVEDSPDDVEIARRAFKKSGIASDLLLARDGQEALDVLFGERARRNGAPTAPPDFILLDINLPKVNGLEVLREIRASDEVAAVPVVVLTASGREEDVNRSYQLGANSYIQKPVVFDRFLEVLVVLGKYWFDVATLPQVPYRERAQP
ncbi:MAG: hypothetical protein A2148_06515 [Chloroflexi bacterium RBG_16_68_14]|nr:MAG: hypothetical protein A2148_06515 [Chloroflexi bacterium RBG_16_68_14]